MKKTLFKCALVVVLGICLAGTLFFSPAGDAHAASNSHAVSSQHAVSRHVSMPASSGGGCSYSSDGILYICISDDTQNWTAYANVYIEESLPSCDVWISIVADSVLYEQWGAWHSCSNKIGWVGGEAVTPAWVMNMHTFASIQNYYGSATSGSSPILYSCC